MEHEDMTTMPKDPKQWTQFPEKKELHQIRVDSLEASTKFEGKWVCNAHVEGLGELKLWMSHKQAGSLHRNLDAPELWAVLDTGNPEKTRFVWASNNREWLEGAFLSGKPREQAPAPQTAPQAKPAAKAAPKKFSGTQTPNRWDNQDTVEELPF
jgi:hypothetical protein